ncbi:hypothetical protein V2E39_13180 [Chryseobacterium arthrosphaerae]|uniref:Uncharacterized protein n=1 Tax=Chryseobacterium arthrosphaerae TaxID=651561 RepID=A0ABU7R100_9FLAO|nr:hypothetical protein [Chryseobacterium arthrosphaerae]
MNPYYNFSMEDFLKYLKSLDINKQKRMLFMVEADFYLYESIEYNTDFGTYPDYQNRGFDKHIRTPFYVHYTRFVFSIPEDVFNKPDDKAKEHWEELKKMLLEELNLKQDIFDYEYQSFIIGLKLKEMRLCSKKEFVVRSGLSLRKINQIEDYCFLAKIHDMLTYAEKGLGRKMSLNFIRENTDKK